MKQFVKSLKKEGDCFTYLGNKFPSISDAKLKTGIFDGPQIRKLLNDDKFTDSMNDREKAAWISFKKVAENSLGNSHLEHFPENLDDYNEEQGERFRKGIKEMERHYQERLDEHMMPVFMLVVEEGCCR